MATYYLAINRGKRSVTLDLTDAGDLALAVELARRAPQLVRRVLRRARLVIAPSTALAEAAHGTVTRHYRDWQAGKKTSTNPIASIYAWTRALIARAEIDGTPEVRQFAETLEDVVIKTVEAGNMTKDLAALVGGTQGYQTTDDFMASLAANLKARLG